jgi:hypothetical protein
MRATIRAPRDSASNSVTKTGRRKFGLDTPLPADPRIVERAILRHIAECRPTFVALALKGECPREAAGLHGEGCRITLEAGVPDLMLMLPGGRLAFLKIKTQAQDLSQAHRAFADLCRERDIPLAVVRSLSEARPVLDLLAI